MIWHKYVSVIKRSWVSLMTGLLTGLVVDSGDGVTHVVCFTFTSLDLFRPKMCSFILCVLLFLKRVIFGQVFCDTILIVYFNSQLANFHSHALVMLWIGTGGGWILIPSLDQATQYCGASYYFLSHRSPTSARVGLTSLGIDG